MPQTVNLEKGERRIVHCDGCHALIIFALTTNGKPAPYDSEPTPSGRNVFQADGYMRALKKDEAPPAGTPRYVSHWATCPAAKAFRERQAARKAAGRG